MSDSMEIVQVFILAENRLLREALTRILSKKNDIHVVGASAFSPDVVEKISSAGPDVLLSDSAAVALSDLRLVSEVRSAIPLTDDQKQRLVEALNKATGKRVSLKVVIDPSVLGGLVARVGDTVIDGTVRHRLDQLRTAF